MEIISHRGFWRDPKEKNSEIAFRRSFSNGFGIETDVRDYKGNLCVSHDIPDDKPMLLGRLFDILSEFDTTLPLFLNIKSDGIHELLKKLLEKYSVKNCFAFDMSIPEMVKYKRTDSLVFFTRMSDVETVPILIKHSKGVWVDNLFDKILLPEDITPYTEEDHLLCFVSPELHGRGYDKYWALLKGWEESKAFNGSKLLLCTDLPKDAYDYFNGGTKP